MRDAFSPRAGRVTALVAAVVLGGCGLLARGPGEREPEDVDLNTASLRKVEQLPGVTPSMARRIVEGRPYESLGDLVERGILTEREAERIEDRVTVEPPR
jgi:hypothetical protein